MEWPQISGGERLTVHLFNLPNDATLTNLMPKVRGGAVFSAFLIDTKVRGLSTGVTAQVRFITNSGAQTFLDYAATSELAKELGGAAMSLSATPTHLGARAIYGAEPMFDKSAKPTRHLKLKGMDSINLEELLNMIDEVLVNTRGKLSYSLMTDRLGAADHLDVPFHAGVDSPLCSLLQDVWIDRRGVTHLLCASICTANWIWKLLLNFTARWNHASGESGDFDYDITYARDPCDDGVDRNDMPPPLRLTWGPCDGFLARFRKSSSSTRPELKETSLSRSPEDKFEVGRGHESSKGRDRRIINKPLKDISFDEMSCLPLDMRLNLEARRCHAADSMPHKPATQTTPALSDDAMVEMVEDLISFDD